jgi:hypothetical protein
MVAVARMHDEILRVNQRRIRHCRDCHAEILWLKHPKGYSVPVDVAAVPIHIKQFKTKYPRHRCEQNDSWRVELTGEAIDAGYEYQEKMDKVFNDGKNPNDGVIDRERWAKGYWGEWAFDRGCELNNIKRDWLPFGDGWRDHDFVVSIRGVQRTIDVKTQFTKDQDFVMGTGQMKNKPWMYAVAKGLKIRDGIIIIFQGALTRDYFHKHGREVIRRYRGKHGTRWVLPLNRLPLRMSQLARLCQALKVQE